MYRAAQIAEASPNGNATIGFSQKYRPENETKKNMHILKEYIKNQKRPENSRIWI